MLCSTSECEGLHSQSAQWELCVSLMVSSRYLRASMLSLALPLSALGNMGPLYPNNCVSGRFGSLDQAG